MKDLALDINRKEFPIGSVVYYIKMRPYELIRFGQYEVAFGIVEDHYPGTVCVQLYEPFDRREINGIPIKQFETPSKWQKLPKGWTYNTELFKLSFTKPSDKWFKEFRLDNPEHILEAIKDGSLVKVQENDHAHIETEIDKNKGWRIVRNYPFGEYHPTYESISFHEIYATYQEAKDVIDKIEAERKRQAELSDYEWSVEQIDHDLDRWARFYSIPDDIKQKYRQWLLSRDNVEDIETRVAEGGIQWKYDKNKKWMNIVI